MLAGGIPNASDHCSGRHSFPSPSSGVIYNQFTGGNKSVIIHLLQCLTHQLCSANVKNN